MLAFIAKYWLEFLFGTVATGATALAKYFYNLYKKEKVIETKAQMQRQEDEILSKAQEMLKRQQEQYTAIDEKIMQQLDSIAITVQTLKEGMLSVQGKQFKQECRDLLVPGHRISVDEWVHLNSEHDIYKTLSGNHEGDLLFQDVEIKYHNQ